MLYLIIFLLGGMITNIHTMEPDPRKDKEQRKGLLKKSATAAPKSSSPYASAPEFSLNSKKISRPRSSSTEEHPHSVVHTLSVPTGGSDSPTKTTPRKLLRTWHHESPRNENTLIEKELLKAVKEGDQDKFLHLLNPDLNCIDSKGKSLLILGIENGNIEIVKTLVANMNVDINKPDIDGFTPLHCAISGDDLNIVQALLTREDIDVNKTEQWENTPLHYAALRNAQLHIRTDKLADLSLRYAALRNHKLGETNKLTDHFLIYQAALENNKNIIKGLLRDCRVNAFLKNGHGNFARELAYEVELKRFMFARATLSNLVEEEVFDLLMNLKSKNEQALQKAVEHVKTKYSNDHTNQEDYEPLPEETKLPEYATDIFIKQMILYRIKSQQMHDKLQSI